MKVFFSFLVVLIVVCAAGWYYLTEIHTVNIEDIVGNPRKYAGKEIAVSGVVKERFSFFVVRYFSIDDSTGIIHVVTEQPLPAVGQKVRVKGHVEEGFSLGEQQVLVFLESKPE